MAQTVHAPQQPDPPQVMARKIRIGKIEALWPAIAPALVVPFFVYEHQWITAACFLVCVLVMLPLCLKMSRVNNKIIEEALRKYEKWYEEQTKTD